MITVDKGFLYAILLSWFVFALCLLSPLIQPDYSYLSISAVVFFILSFFLYYLGYLSSSVLFRFKINSINYNFILNLLLFFVVSAFFLRFVDRFYIRPVDDFFSFKSYREARELGSNFVSVLAGFLLPVVFVLYSCLKNNSSLAKSGKYFFSVFFLYLILLDMFFSGSRGGLLVILVLMFSEKVSVKNIFFIGPLFMFFFSGLFLYRFFSVSSDGELIDIIKAVSIGGYATFVPYSSFSAEVLISEFGSLLIFPLIQVNQYLIHGFFEFLYIYSNSDGGYGVSHLMPHFLKFTDVVEEQLRPGMYYTIVGSVYYGFGVIGSFFLMLLIGFFYGIVLPMAKTLSRGCYFLVLLSVFLMPYVNSFGGYDIYLYLLSIVFVFFILKVKLIG